MGAIGYPLLFNRRTRQSLHVLAVGAYVVHAKDGPIGAPERIWRVHFGVVGLILTASLAVPYFTQRLAGSAPFRGLLSVQRGLQKEPGVWHAAVSRNVAKYFMVKTRAATTHIFSAKIFLSRPVTDLQSLADRTARIILNRDPSVAKEDEIAVTIVYGHDIGIASSWRSRSFAHSPGQWRQRLSSHRMHL